MATELVGIELKLLGAEGVYDDMKKLDTMVRQLGGRHKIEFELGQAKQKVLELTGEINQTTRAIDKTKDRIKILKEALKEIDEGDEYFEQLQEAIKSANKELEAEQQHLKNTRNQLKDVRQEVNELSNALGRVKPLKRVFDDISLTVARMGSALQSAGNALTRFSAPVRMLMGGAIMGAGYEMLGKATEGLKSGFSRYDTMKKYERLMAEYSTETYDAAKSVQDLDASVQGLPIALDDAVSLAQRYTLSLGDMERGTKLAIATNNAFLASMATENQRYQGMLQMQDLLNGKKLNSREWMSLGASMGKAINEIGKEFGYTNENMGEFRQELYAGHIATKDFLDALEKVGTGEGALVKLAEESKNTWEAFFSRIGTAFSRVGYNVLLSMDKLISTATGGKFDSLNSFLDDKVIPSIDKLKDSTVAWIDANPDKILDFVNSFKGIDWKGILTGFAEGIADIAGSIKKFADIASGMNLSWLGKFFAKSGPIGWFLTVSGGLLKGTRHIWAGLGTAITALVRHLTAGKLEGGIFGKITLLFGKKKDIEAAGDAAKSIPTVADTFDLDVAERTCFKGGQYDTSELSGFEKTVTYKAITPNFWRLLPMYKKGYLTRAWDRETVEMTVKALTGTDYGYVTLDDIDQNECGFISIQVLYDCRDSQNVSEAMLERLAIPSKVDMDGGHYQLIDNGDGSTTILFNEMHIGRSILIAYPKVVEVADSFDITDENVNEVHTRMSYVKCYTDGSKFRFVYNNVLVTSFPDALSEDDEQEGELTLNIQRDANGRFGYAYRIIG